jgi:NAD(P)-dependent dehydrogenase (short-subunit alcohol dehydrogenase family)
LEIMVDFKDKLILVTGAARGIGRAVAFEYARAGARLIILDVLGDKLNATASTLRADGYTVHAFTCDLSSDKEVESLGAKIKGDIGVPDILHNNAFYAPTGTIENIDLNGARQAFEVSVLGYLRIVKAFLTEMIERKSGWIVNTASPNGITPPIQFAANGLPYNLCKAADISISQTMAASLKKHNIGVSVLYPGAVHTEASSKPHGNVKPEFAEALRKFFLEQAVAPEVAAKDLVEGVRQGKFLVTTFKNFEKVLVEFAQNGLDPNAEYSWGV